MDEKIKLRFEPSLCVTHDCNLSCVYCYQKHNSGSRMTLDTAKLCIDWIFANIPKNVNGVQISFIGGEPLLEFDLIKEIVSFTCTKYKRKDKRFFAATNGTLLDKTMKEWFTSHKDCFVLGLSLDGAKKTHDLNRANSFDLIDFDFFFRNWPQQGVKMTLSEHSLGYLAENIKFINSRGFFIIDGVNLAEGSINWDNDDFIKILIPQLKDLVEYYKDDNLFVLNQMFNKPLALCEAKELEPFKWCGIGTGCPFFDTDGTKYPCQFISPMTFSTDDLDEILKTDFDNTKLFIDEDCHKNCYIYPICPTCAGADYLKNKSFAKRDKSKCRIQKLIILFLADLLGKRIIQNLDCDNKNMYQTISAIKKIRELYLPEFKDFFE